MGDTALEHILVPDFALWQRIRGKRVPIQFTLEFTARCNNACRHCYINLPVGDNTARQRELTVAEITRFVGEAGELGALWCLLSGGEPLLRDDFADAYLAIKRQGMLVSLFTNACLVTPAHVELFKRYPPRDLEVTVYGITQATYERVSGCPGSYAAFRRGLDLLLEAGIPVRLKAMALRSNVDELPAIADFCRAHTCDYFRFDPVLHLRYDRNPTRNDDIRSERLSPMEVAALDAADPDRSDAVRELCGKDADNPLPVSSEIPLIACGAGIMLFAIGSDGFFRLCPSLCHPDWMYDLRQGSLTDAWNTFTPERLAQLGTNPAQLAACYGCSIRDLCLWCPAHAHLEIGELEASCAYFCQTAHARAGKTFLDQ